MADERTAEKEMKNMDVEVVWEQHSELVETIRCDQRGDETLMSKKDFEEAIDEVLNKFGIEKCDGCEAYSADRVEDEGMNMLCPECAKLDAASRIQSEGTK